MTLPVGLTSEIQKLAPSAVIELFVLDATAIGGDVLRFHAGTNGLSGNIVWQGQTYVRFPVQASGFEFTSKGQFPRPKLRVSNVFSAITLVLMENNDLIGAKVTRRRTFARFLDAVNFPGGVNASADPTAEFQDDVYFIDRKANEDRDLVEFELAASVDLVGVTLPRRQIIQNVCVWKYRGAECGYTGPPFFDENDQRIPAATTTAGQALLSAYDAYVASESALAAANLALANASRAKDAAGTILLLSTQYDGNAVLGATTYVVRQDYSTGIQTAWWNGSPVTLGLYYRVGSFKSDSFFGSLFSIQQWGVDSAALAAATTAYNSALTARNTAQTNRNSALVAYQAAFSALPPTDALYTFERCGKRLTSCKARFGSTAELPFGSFPAAGLIK